MPKELNPDNLASGIKEEKLKKIGALCVQEYDSDVESRTDYDKRRAGWLKLFAGKRDPKGFPWKDASNTHIPLLAEAALQFQARSMEALIPPKEIVKGYATDGVAVDTAQRVAKHMNWQLLYQMEDWEEGMDGCLLLLPLMGSAYKKTYWDPIKKRVSSILLSPDEFVTPYRCKRIEDAPRKTQVLWMHLNDIRKREKDGIFINVDPNWEGTELTTASPMPEYQQVADHTQGQEEPLNDSSNRRVILEQHCLLDINYDPVSNKFLKEDGIQRPYVVWIDKETEAVLRVTSRLYWDDELQELETFEYFTHYGFIPNPDSHYSFGFGHLVDHINETADTLLNQIIDAGTLSNVRGGFVNQRSGLKKGAITFELGKYVPVDVNGDDVRKALYEFNFAPPSSVLFTLLDMLRGYVKDLTTTADWMSGALPPSDTAATTMLAVIEQGLKVFSTIQKRCHRSLKRELKKIFLLNRIYLDEQVYFMVQDSTSPIMQTYQTGRADYSSNIDVIPVSDPNITSRAEQLIKSQQVLAEVKQNPLTMQNPEAIYYATREYLKTLGVTTELDAVLPKPEPPPEPPDLTPQEENAAALKEQYSQPLEIQDHLAHLFNHETFMQSEWGTRLTPQGKNVMDQHVKEHLAFAYLAEEQQKIAEYQQGMMPLPAGGTNGATVNQPTEGGSAGMEQPDVNSLLYSKISNMAGGIQGGLA